MVLSQVTGNLKKGFLNNNAEILKTLYKTLVRPHLEYANQSWKLYLKKHILMLKVSRGEQPDSYPALVILATNTG